MKMLTARYWIVAVALAACAAVPAQSRVPAAAPDAQPATEARTIFERWDTNADSALSATEFAAGWRQVQAANMLRKLRENFVARDGDRNGSLGASEYLKLDLVRKAGSSAPPLASFDADKSEGLDFEEYVALVDALIRTAR